MFEPLPAGVRVRASSSAGARLTVISAFESRVVFVCQLAHTNLKCYKVRPLKPTAVQATATVTVQL